jgi:hypothetical protein
VQGISGDKDVELHVGDLSVAVGNAADYRSADASVITGDLTLTLALTRSPAAFICLGAARRV